MLLIEFVHGHNPMLLRRMSKPDMFTCREHLMLSTSTLDQLNVTSQTKPSGSASLQRHTLCNVVNKCSTKAGKRLLYKSDRSYFGSARTAPSVRPNRRIRCFGGLSDRVHQAASVVSCNDDPQAVSCLRHCAMLWMPPGDMAACAGEG